MKKALILGTSTPQADAVVFLKQAGWWVIGCGYRREGKALDIIDQFELVDIKDWEAVEALARREGIDLIYSVGSEIAMPTVARVAPRLGLPCFVRLETTHLLLNKAELRTFLASHAISPVKFRAVRCQQDLAGWDTFPAMVKPTDSWGQRGVFRAESLEEIEAGLQRSLDFSMNKTVIVEEFLAGPEISANVFVVNSRVVFNEISDRLVVSEYPGGIPRGHVLPSKVCTGVVLDETKALVERCIRALGIENGPAYFQMKLTTDGPRIVEIMPRLDGCHIWRLIKTVGGVDLIEAIFKLLNGEPVDLQMRPDGNTYKLMFLLCPDGEFRMADYPIPSDAVYVETSCEEGVLVRPGNGFLDRVGYYICKEC